TAYRRIWLCADDYGISPGVNAGIRELIARGRINATSIMVAAPLFNRREAAALDSLNSGEKRAALGLHVTLSAPFKPLSTNFAPRGSVLATQQYVAGGNRKTIAIGTAEDRDRHAAPQLY